jgi:hypothetical protein
MRRGAQREAGERDDVARFSAFDVGPVAQAPGDLAFRSVRGSGQRRCRYWPTLAEETRERERRVVACGKRALQGASERVEVVGVS